MDSIRTAALLSAGALMLAGCAAAPVEDAAPEAPATVTAAPAIVPIAPVAARTRQPVSLLNHLTTPARVVGKLEAGTAVTIERTAEAASGSWRYVTTADYHGWVPASVLDTGPAAP